jgi:putative peptidoglycan lipid II flippase
MNKFLRKSNFKQAVLIIFLFDNIAKILSFLRNVIITTNYGFSKITDSFNLANNIVTTPINLISDAILAGVIPFLNEKKNKQEKVNFIYSVALLNIGVLTFLSILFYYSFDYIIKLLAPGFSGEETKYVYRFGIILLLSAQFSIFMRTIEGYFRAEKIFGVSNVINFISSVVAIVTLFFLIKKHYLYIVISQLIGVFLGFILFFIVAPKKITKIDKEVTKLLWFSVPLILGGGMGIINNFVDKAFASTLVQGELSALTYSFLMVSVLGSSIIGPISGAAFSFISTSVSIGDLMDVENRLKKIANVYVMFFVFCSILFHNFGETVLKIIFLKGKVTIEDIALLYDLTTIYFSINLYTGTGGLIIQVFHSYKNAFMPTTVSSVFIIIHIILNFLFVKYFGAYALAGSTIFVSLISTFTLNYILFKKYAIKILNFNHLLVGFLMIISSVVCVIYSNVYANFINALLVCILIINRMVDIDFIKKTIKKRVNIL